MQPGESVLVLAAAGGVGTLLVQLAARAGAEVTGAASTPEKRELAASLGATPRADYGLRLYVRRRVRRRRRRGRPRGVPPLRPGGRMVSFGLAPGPGPTSPRRKPPPARSRSSRPAARTAPTPNARSPPVCGRSSASASRSNRPPPPTPRSSPARPSARRSCRPVPLVGRWLDASPRGCGHGCLSPLVRRSRPRPGRTRHAGPRRGLDRAGHAPRRAGADPRPHDVAALRRRRPRRRRVVQRRGRVDQPHERRRGAPGRPA